MTLIFEESCKQSLESSIRELSIAILPVSLRLSVHALQRHVLSGDQDDFAAIYWSVGGTKPQSLVREMTRHMDSRESDE